MVVHTEQLNQDHSTKNAFANKRNDKKLYYKVLSRFNVPEYDGISVDWIPFRDLFEVVIQE